MRHSERGQLDARDEIGQLKRRESVPAACIACKGMKGLQGHRLQDETSAGIRTASTALVLLNE